MNNLMYAVCAVMIAASCVAQEVEIKVRGYHDGTLTFNQISNAAYYRVDWAPKAHGPWSRTWASFQCIPATASNDDISVSVPNFYKVTAMLKGTLFGLIAHFSFHEKDAERITDRSGRGNYGDLYGATWVETNAMGGAYAFDGVNDYIELGRSDLYQTSGQLSGCAWVYRKARHMVFLSNYRGGAAYNGMFDFVIDDAGSFYASFGQGPGEWLCYAAATPDIVPSNEWHHVAFTYDERRGVGHKIQLYYDGVGITNYTIHGEGNGGPILQTGDQLRIMAHRAPVFSQGMIHEIMLFDRALSDMDVKEIYEMEQ
jgi:hypothetical protein